MADLAFYERHLGISDVQSLSNLLCATLIETNHTYNFFVDWEKAIQNRDVFKYETALLKSLRGSRNGAGDLGKLLERYPEVGRVIPSLLAFRDKSVKVLDAVEPEVQCRTFDFSKNRYSPEEIRQIVEFTQKTGLLDALCQMESSADYLLGVEVGLDTNARKNRSGAFLEQMVEKIIKGIISRYPHYIWIEQKNFDYARRKYNIQIPSSLSSRKFDHVIITDGRAVNIEVNFYGGTGSKPSEIVSSYTDRNRVLKSSGWKFVWLTDGDGWKSMRSPLNVGIENIDYVINAHLLRNGILEKILLNE